MRIGISIDTDCIKSVLVNDNGMIVETQTTLPKDNENMAAVLKHNIKNLTSKRELDIHGVFINVLYIKKYFRDLKNLNKVGVIRLAGHNPDFIEPCANWPKQLKNNIFSGFETINGGYEFDGNEITPLEEKEVVCAASNLVASGAQSLVICGVFSTFFKKQEEMAKNLINLKFPISITCAHEFSSMGFLEKENISILNAALQTKSFYEKMYQTEELFKELDMNCPIYFIESNGSLITTQEALHTPIKMIESDIASAFVGASKLSQYQNAIVMHFDETTVVGHIKNGFPYQTVFDNTFFNIPIKYEIPKTVTYNFGKYSKAHIEGDQIELLSDDSNEGVALIDAGHICGAVEEGKELSQLSTHTAYKVIEKAEQKLFEFYDEANLSGFNLPFILVGPGALIFPQHPKIFRPMFCEYASAYGAAMADVSYTSIECVNVEDTQEATLEELKSKAFSAVLEKGAFNPRISYCEVFPYYYLPGNWMKVKLVASGDLTEVPKKIYDVNFMHERYGKIS